MGPWVWEQKGRCSLRALQGMDTYWWPGRWSVGCCCTCLRRRSQVSGLARARGATTYPRLGKCAEPARWGGAFGWGRFFNVFTPFDLDLRSILLTALRGQVFHLRAWLRSLCRVNSKRTSSLKDGKWGNMVSSLVTLFNAAGFHSFSHSACSWQQCFTRQNLQKSSCTWKWYSAVTYLSWVAKSEYCLFQGFATYLSRSWRFCSHHLTS